MQLTHLVTRNDPFSGQPVGTSIACHAATKMAGRLRAASKLLAALSICYLEERRLADLSDTFGPGRGELAKFLGKFFSRRLLIGRIFA